MSSPPTPFILATPARPEALYLDSLSSGSRPTMICALETVAHFYGAPKRSALPWHELRYEHTLRLRTWLIELVTTDQTTAPRYAPATANRILAATRGVLREALRLELISESDFRRACDLPAIRGKRILAGRALGQAELRAMFGAAAKEVAPLNARDAAILSLLYGAGLRRTETVSLDLAHVVGRCIKVLGKGNSERLVYLSANGVRALEAWIAQRGPEPGPLLYPTRGGRARGRAELERRRMSSDTILGMVERLAERAGIAHTSPHDFRRSFISDLLDVTGDLVSVQELAGHSDPATTARYNRRGERAKSLTADLIHVPYAELS